MKFIINCASQTCLNSNTNMEIMQRSNGNNQTRESPNSITY